jgi:glutathione synthase/RimK-type ligase-like ATP-grasp enzyme
MDIGILSKRKIMLTGDMKRYFEDLGHKVTIYTYKNLTINRSLLDYDFFILKSKKLFYLYAGYYLEANNIPVIPSTEISHKQKQRIEAHLLLKQINIESPDYYFGNINTLYEKLKPSDFPLISKPLMGSGSKNVLVLNSHADFKLLKDNYIYLEKFIDGTHYLTYFIGDEICNCQKRPLANEHAQVEIKGISDDIKEIVCKWKNKYNLLFGHLDMVREASSNKLYVVDPGPFPEFTNWKCDKKSTKKICDLILRRYEKIKN